MPAITQKVTKSRCALMNSITACLHSLLDFLQNVARENLVVFLCLSFELVSKRNRHFDADGSVGALLNWGGDNSAFLRSVVFVAHGVCKSWDYWRALNQRPPAYKAGALTVWATVALSRDDRNLPESQKNAIYFCNYFIFLYSIRHCACVSLGKTSVFCGEYQGLTRISLALFRKSATFAHAPKQAADFAKI